MWHRVTGALIVVGAGVLIFFGLRGLGADMRSATGIADLAKMYAMAIDPSDWLFHWRVTSTLYLLCGVLGLVIGIAMFLHRQWSLLLLALTATSVVLLGIVGTVTGYSRYAFEQAKPIPSIALVVLAAIAFVAYRRFDHGTTRKSDA